MRVLIAHESPEQCERLQALLGGRNHDVQAIRSANGALMLLEAAEKKGRPYQLLLVNGQLQDKGGADFLCSLVERQQFQPAVIFFTGVGNDSAEWQKDWAAKSLLLPSTVDADGLVAAMTELEHVSPVKDGRPAGGFFHWPQSRVLLVDDNDMGRQMVRTLLENFAIQVTVAENGLEAVEQIRQEDFDLILMDVRMPAMDGLEATRAIRSLGKPGTAQIPILALSANTLPADQEKCLSAGMNGCLAKPVELVSLHDALKSWLPETAASATEPEPQAMVIETGFFETMLECIDIATGLRRTLGKTDLYLTLLKKFAVQFADFSETLPAELQQGEKEQAVLRVHSLKGVSAGLGARHLPRLAGELEKQLEDDHEPLAREEMLQELARVVRAIEQLPDLQKNSRENLPPGSGEDFCLLLDELLEPLQHHQVKGVKAVMARLQEKRWPAVYARQLEQLEEAVEKYRFIVARELIEGFRADQEQL